MNTARRGAVVPKAMFQQFASAKPRNLPRAKGRTEPKVRGRMNKGEAAYALQLDQRIAAGHVAAWWFEFVTIRLADETHYRPDFLVQLPDGTLELHEVKGRKGETFYATEDGWLKVKLCAEMAPFPVVVVWPNAAGYWQERRV